MRSFETSGTKVRLATWCRVEEGIQLHEWDVVRSSLRGQSRAHWSPVSVVDPSVAARRMGDADMQSVRTGSDFWAGTGAETEASSMFTADLLNGQQTRRLNANTPSSDETPRPSKQQHQHQRQAHRHGNNKNGKRAAHRGGSDSDSGTDSDGTQIAGHGGGGGRAVVSPPKPSEVVDEVGAFIRPN